MKKVLYSPQTTAFVRLISFSLLSSFVPSIAASPHTAFCHTICVSLRTLSLCYNTTRNVRITYHCGAFANHCCSGKAVSIIYLCVCMFAEEGRRGERARQDCACACECSLAYPPCKAYASYCDVICGFSGSTIFFDIPHKRHDFREKGTEHKMRVLIFSTTFV